LAEQRPGVREAQAASVGPGSVVPPFFVFKPQNQQERLMSESPKAYGMVNALAAAIIALCQTHPNGEEILIMAERVRTCQEEYDLETIQAMFGNQPSPQPRPKVSGKIIPFPLNRERSSHVQ
jgi:hypothetical protein